MSQTNSISFKELQQLKALGERMDAIAPQPGPQHEFYKTQADICIFGGAAGGGKSMGLLLIPLLYILDNSEFNATLWRRTHPQLTMPGGLISESRKMYPRVGAGFNGSTNRWKFNGGGELSFMSMQYTHNEEDKQGLQSTYAGIDELCTWEESQVWQIWSRLRGISGINPFLRATCNPDSESWVKDLIKWWIDEHGFAIPERSGVLRWMYRDKRDGELIWFDDKRSAVVWWIKNHPKEWALVNAKRREMSFPTSLTFIPSKLEDNKRMNEADPHYRAKLEMLPLDKQRIFLDGCWNVRLGEGDMFKREWVGDPLPYKRVGNELYEGSKLITKITRAVRGWDLAHTEKSPKNENPDFTCGTLVCECEDGLYYVLDHVWDRRTTYGVEQMMVECGNKDPNITEISIPKDPAAGAALAPRLVKALSGFNVSASPEARSADSNLTAKEYRFLAFASQAQAGNVKIIKGDWNSRWLNQLEGFPRLKHKDDVDSTSRAFNTLFVSYRAGDLGAII